MRFASCLFYFGNISKGPSLFQDFNREINIQVVAEARSSEAFVALCLLTVAGTSLITQKLGFSDTVCFIFKCLRTTNVNSLVFIFIS